MIGVSHISERLTAARQEFKFLVSPQQAGTVAAFVRQHVPPHVFREGAQMGVPGARHYTSTVYFDTAGRELYAAAKDDPASIKVRAREYYEAHLGPVARPGGLPRAKASSILWVEIKQTDGVHSSKRRVGIPKRDLERFFEAGGIHPSLLEAQRRAHRESTSSVLGELVAVCRGFSSALRPTLVVNYRRSAWQHRQHTVRITIDHDVAYFRPQPAMWAEPEGLQRAHLGTPVGRAPACVVEIKVLGAVPGWISELRALCGQPPVRFSKFVDGCNALRA